MLELPCHPHPAEISDIPYLCGSPVVDIPRSDRCQSRPGRSPSLTAPPPQTNKSVVQSRSPVPEVLYRHRPRAPRLRQFYDVPYRGPPLVLSSTWCCAKYLFDAKKGTVASSATRFYSPYQQQLCQRRPLSCHTYFEGSLFSRSATPLLLISRLIWAISTSTSTLAEIEISSSLNSPLGLALVPAPGCLLPSDRGWFELGARHILPSLRLRHQHPPSSSLWYPIAP